FKNVVTAIKQIVISKLMPVPVMTEEDLKAAEREANMSNRQRKKQEKVRSLHHIDDEDYESVSIKPSTAYGDEPETTEEKNGLIEPAALKEDKPDHDKKKKS
ncbi:MAG: hypothetical protein IKL84_08215, partial [Clostridia bacterium]|nr:hypothetical protein [Clostridia bacterium]